MSTYVPVRWSHCVHTNGLNGVLALGGRTNRAPISERHRAHPNLSTKPVLPPARVSLFIIHHVEGENSNPAHAQLMSHPLMFASFTPYNQRIRSVPKCRSVSALEQLRDSQWMARLRMS